jgi:CTP-dependent riboflavin kinase
MTAIAQLTTAAAQKTLKAHYSQVRYDAPRVKCMTAETVGINALVVPLKTHYGVKAIEIANTISDCMRRSASQNQIVMSVNETGISNARVMRGM